MVDIQQENSKVTPPTKKFTTVAETPKWRFVAKAKSTEGYSSCAAGQVIEGKSARELIAKYYVASSSDSDNESVISSSKLEVGKLAVTLEEDEYIESFEGGIVVSPTSQTELDTNVDSKIWVYYHSKSTQGTQSNDSDKDQWNHNEVNDSSSGSNLKSVGKLALTEDDILEESFDGEFTRRKKADHAILIPLGTAGDGTTTVNTTGSDSPGNSDKDSGSDEQAGDTNGKGITSVARRFNPTRRKALLLSSILLLVIIGAVLGSRKKKPSDGTRAFVPVILLPDNTTNTTMPSSMPSSMPSYLTPPWEEDTNDTEPLVVNWIDTSVEDITAPPTASPSIVWSSLSPITNSPTPQPITSHPVSERPSPSPSRSPAASSSPPTRTPETFYPTQKPSISPLVTPTSSQPTSVDCLDRNISQEVCKTTPSCFWNKYQKVCEDFVSYRPSRSPTTNSPTRRPITNSPSRRPVTDSPSSSPEVAPTTKEPTNRPTETPCVADADINICMGIDSSASICNGPLGKGGCEECKDECNSGGQDKSVCCDNFANMLEFSRSLFQLLGDLPSKQDYSIVHFSNRATTVSTRQNATQARETIRTLIYEGSGTNTAEAINACQSTLDDAPADRKNLMFLLTEGLPSGAVVHSQDDAISAATNAKNKGTIILPIVIQDKIGKDGTAFLTNDISSGRNFVFTPDFESLGYFQDTIFEQVVCQSPPDCTTLDKEACKEGVGAQSCKWSNKGCVDV